MNMETTGTIFSNQGIPDYSAFAAQYGMKYLSWVYQGDVGQEQNMSNALVPTAGAYIPTGSICYVDKTTGKAVSDLPKGTAGNHPVPYIVIVGTNTVGVQSQVGNAAGGLITAIPATGYYRIMTTVYDQTAGITYACNDLLTARKVTRDFEFVGSKQVCMVSKLNANDAAIKPYVDVIVGIVSPAVTGTDGLTNNNDVLCFDCKFLPATEA